METIEKKYQLIFEEGSITTRFVKPTDSIGTLVLSHGAGAGISHKFMIDIQKYLAEVGVNSFSFNFLYRELGKRTPFRMSKPIKTFEEIWKHVSENLTKNPMFIAGKSYGGRVGSHALKNLDNAKGLIFLGYPFHPPNNLEKLRTEHLYEINLPMLFLQGTRDKLSTQGIANDFVSKHKTSKIVWLEDGDHSWKPRKKSGFTQEDHMRQACKEIRNFVQEYS